MPHKRNPTHAVAARAAARLAVAELSGMLGAEQEQERAAGGWQAEWVALPSALVRTGGALRRLVQTLERLDFDPARAAANLQAGLGVGATDAAEALRGVPALIDRALATYRRAVQ
jgi:3-carboxy-cis,cis-muconate cycloisomerase